MRSLLLFRLQLERQFPLIAQLIPSFGGITANDVLMGIGLASLAIQGKVGPENDKCVPGAGNVLFRFWYSLRVGVLGYGRVRSARRAIQARW